MEDLKQMDKVSVLNYVKDAFERSEVDSANGGDSWFYRGLVDTQVVIDKAVEFVPLVHDEGENTERSWMRVGDDIISCNDGVMTTGYICSKVGDIPATCTKDELGASIEKSDLVLIYEESTRDGESFTLYHRKSSESQVWEEVEIDCPHI